MSTLFKKLIFVLIISIQSVAYADVLSRLNVEFGLEFPTYFGVHAKISQQDQNLYMRLGSGVVHSVMLETPFASQLMNWTSALEDNEMSLVIDSLSNSIYAGLSFGYRQSARSGFYGELGYSSIFRLEPKEVPVESIQNVLNRTLGAEVTYDVQATLHNGTFHGGYMLPLSQHVSVSAELGLIKPLFVQVGLDYKGATQAEQYEKEDSNKVRDLIGSLWMVTGALWVSVTF